MPVHDAFDLWGYARGALPPEARGLVEAHLAGCSACTQALESLRAAQNVLAYAEQAPGPRVDWARVDGAVREAAERRFFRPERGWGLAWAGGALAAACLAALALKLWTPGGVAPSTPGSGTVAQAPVIAPPPSSSPPGESSTVEDSQAAERWAADASHHPLAAGGRVRAGEWVRTEAQGSATLKLPDTSRVRLSAGSELLLVRAAGDDVALQLNRGRVAAQAAHVARKAFSVEANGVVVRILGTVFSVNRTEREVEVAVAEGRVRVEPRDSAPRMVGAGERLVLERGRTPRLWALNAADRAEFKKLGTEPPPPPPPTVAVLGRPPGAVAPPPAPTPAPALTQEPPPAPPRASSTPGGGEWATAPVPVGEAPAAMPPPSAPPIVEGEPAPPPAVAKAQRRPPPGGVGSPLNFRFSPLPAVKSLLPGKVVVNPGDPLPDSVEAIFIHRAEEALTRGTCEGFLLGLGELTEHTEDPVTRGKARILRGRCFDDRLKPLEAKREYRLYLEEFPAGEYAAEAKRGAGD